MCTYIRFLSLAIIGLSIITTNSWAINDALPPPTITQPVTTTDSTEKSTDAQSSSTTTEEDESSVIDEEVTIIKKDKQTIEEHRINGRLYMVKVIPDVGPAYYLIDTDGDGFLETSRYALRGNFAIPQWVIFSW